MNLTKKQIDALGLRLRAKRIKVELLDFDLKTIDSIEGRVIDGSITADATNDIRRSGSLTISVPINYGASNFLTAIGGFTVQVGGKVWIDRNIKISVGIDDYITGETVWYKLGVFLINQPTSTTSADTLDISFDCIDLMAKLTGARNGQLTRQAIQISAGEYKTLHGDTVWVKTETRQALIAVLTELGNVKNYTIYPLPQKYKYLPYDIKIESTATVYDVLKKFMDILSTWQMYFDLDGVFRIEPIPSGKDDIVYPLESNQIITDQQSADFENVKNQVIIYGRTNNIHHYTENTTQGYTAMVSQNAGFSASDINLNLSTFGAKVNEIAGAYTFLYFASSWEIYGSVVNLSEYGITVYGTPHENCSFTITYTPNAPDNVRVGTTSTYSALSLKYSSLDISAITVGGTNFGFNTASEFIIPQPPYVPSATLKPLKYITIYNNGSLLKSNAPVVSYNGEKDEIDIRNIEANETYFIRIYDATLKEDGTVDWSQDVTFEFMGRQSASSCLIDDNIDSPFYVNYGLSEPNFYCGKAYFIPISPKTIGTHYGLQLNNKEPINTLADKTILTFMANYTNSYASGASATTIEVMNSSGQIISSGDIPLVQNIWQGGVRPSVPEGKLTNDYTIWQIQYDATNNQFVLLGTNPCAITLVLSGGEYENIYCDVLAYERNVYELYLHSNLNNTIDIGVVPNYAVDVNMKIPYDTAMGYPKGINAPSEIQYYLTKTITYPLGLDDSPQDISAIEIYDTGNLMGSDYYYPPVNSI